jgi:glycosyltransferase involved in cell wall biosynthesis
LSKYEGVPVTINEALILGTPVIATMVGGIPEQLGYGMWGKLVNGNNEEINSLIKNLIIDKNWMTEQKLKLNHYKYNNENIIQEIKRIFN